MLKQYQNIFGGVFRVTDAVVIGLVWIFSYWARFYLPGLEVTKGFPKFEVYAALTPLVMIMWLTVLTASKVYHSRRMLRRTDEAHLILRAHGISMLLFIALTYLISEYRYSRAVMLYFGILGGFFLIFFRLVLRNTLRHFRKKGLNLRYLVIAGEGKAVSSLIWKLEKFPELGLRVVGLITHPQSETREILGKPVLGHYPDTQVVLNNYSPDLFLISLPRKEYLELDKILESVRDETMDIHLLPDIHEYITLGCEIEDFEGIPIVRLNDSPLNGWSAFGKRFTDIILSFVGGVMISPFFLFLCLLIKLTSKGPVFYRQERMGLDGKPFEILKFRTMVMNAESSTGAVWASENDLRKTALGRFLRALSLDELPQLWNVLVGEMSLVGPRPERPNFVQQFKREIPHYMLRHKVKAGMTGWAQINGWRGNSSLDRRIECDLYYIKNWSYFLDWKILLLTLWKGFINKNAY